MRAVEKMMSTQDVVDEVVVRLDELSDPVRIEVAKNYYPTSLTVKGVAVPKLRPIVKDLRKRFGKGPPEDVLSLAKRLKEARILEVDQIAYELIDKNRAVIESLTLDDCLVLGEGMDNWVSVDCFAGMVAGPAWRLSRFPDSVVEDWAVSEDRWWRRAAVVCTVALNQKSRGGTGDPERTLKICSIVASDKDDMVAKALSWALRELSKREQEPVLAFVEEYENVLPKRVLREVRRKIETGRKYG
jgi:3-methyladenine DNA glycosylase AlkD